MLEAIPILRGLFGDGPFSFSGRFYTITEMDGGPKPIQKPHPPFLIGGTRERVLRLAAREGDIVGIDLRQEGEAILDEHNAGVIAHALGWHASERTQVISRHPDRRPARSRGPLPLHLVTTRSWEAR